VGIEFGDEDVVGAVVDTVKGLFAIVDPLDGVAVFVEI